MRNLRIKVRHVPQSNTVLIINRKQFGYHLDTYAICRHAAGLLQTTYLCLDGPRQKIHAANVNVKYVSRDGGIVRRYLRFLRAAINQSRQPYDLLFIKYFPGCSILRLLSPNRRHVLDIRTGSIAPSWTKRLTKNALIRLEASVFQRITVISESLARRLRLPKRKTHILPAGAEPCDATRETLNGVHLLYVGTFSGRKLEHTIEGFERFYHEYSAQVEMSYTIVGDGYRGELTKLRAIVVDRELSHAVHLPGFIHNTRLWEYYKSCNVGVSFVPMTRFYDVQPPTKTIEYLLSGMPVIATATSENRRLVNDTNGVLIDDSPQGFYEGLQQFLQRRHSFDEASIRHACRKYTWERIVKNNAVPYFRRVCRA